jgi:hypothetical protein
VDFGIIALLLVAVVVGIRLIAGSLDGDRIEAYVRDRGGKLRSRRWTPLGKGWFGESSDRIYAIEWEDRDGNRRAATAKTSMFTGVYLTEDRIVRRRSDRDEKAADAASEVERLREENARLKAELTRRL